MKRPNESCIQDKSEVALQEAMSSIQDISSEGLEELFKAVTEEIMWRKLDKLRIEISHIGERP